MLKMESCHHADVDKSPLSAFKPSHSRSSSTGSSRLVSVLVRSSLHVYMFRMCQVFIVPVTYFETMQHSRDWEVMTDIQCSTINPDKNSIPGICEGYLMKKRKYPLQGWHKVRDALRSTSLKLFQFFLISVCFLCDFGLAEGTD